MMSRIHNTRLVLSFHGAFQQLALDLIYDLRVANIDVEPNKWEGSEPAFQSINPPVEESACVVIMVTACETTKMWVGDEWKNAVYHAAGAINVPVLVVRAGPCEVPDFLGGRSASFADIYDRNRRSEVRRLILKIRELTGDESIKLPSDAQPKEMAEHHKPVVPIVVEVGSALCHLVMEDGNPAIFDQELITMMRDGLFYELGVVFPHIDVYCSEQLSQKTIRIILNGIPERDFDLEPGYVMVNDTVPRLTKGGFNARPTRNPANNNPSAWIPESQADAAEQCGLTTWDERGYIILALSVTLRNRAATFVSIDSVQYMLNQNESAFPHLVSETIPSTVSLFVLTDVCRRLVAEAVSIRNLRRVLMSLAKWGRLENDPLMLANYVRTDLKRYISYKFTRGQNTLLVFLLEPEFEDIVRKSITYTVIGSYMDLPPEHIRVFMNAVRSAVEQLFEGVQIPVILTNIEIRSSVRHIIAATMPHLHVLTYQELVPDINIQPLGRIGLGGADLTRMHQSASIKQFKLHNPPE